MKRIFAIALLIVPCSLINAQAEEPLALSLQEAQDYAATHNYEMLDKQREFLKARQTILETASRGLPQISASWDYQWQPQIPAQPIVIQGELQTVAFGVSHTNRATLQANQLILDASYFVALQATRVVKKTVELEMESTELEVKKNVAQSYYGVLVSQELEKLLTANLVTLQKQLKDTRALYENGFLEEQDADQLEILVNNLQINLDNARRQSVLAKRLLKLNLGIDQAKSIALTTAIEEAIMPEETALNLAQKNFNYQEHIDFRAVLSQEQGAQLQVKNQTMSYLPTINGFVQAQRSKFQEDFNNAFGFNQDWIPSSAVGLSLNWDLFTGMRRHALREKAKLDLERVEVAKKATQNQLIVNYEQARSNYTFALKRYQNQKRSMELSKKILNRTRIKYKEGISSSLDLTQTENQHQEAQQNYINALQQLLNAREELTNALGK